LGKKSSVSEGVNDENRIVPASAAVETGEKVGFTGHAAGKIDAYMRPLYNALYDMLDPGFRGQGNIDTRHWRYFGVRRDSFLILDEA